MFSIFYFLLVKQPAERMEPSRVRPFKHLAPMDG